ncbi:uncharacterized protein LOC106137521 [Amyelois transitella]|uniref:uncharacterized protein LOC106137521 n=1 Tax=Amyelois transitella TaxID=680683 RepID=UPI00298FFC5D|nr:uncharacterized protein LOC106137521 [Amyelois transitella]
MVNYYIYAKDFSGSTGNVPYYHANGLKTLRDFKNDVAKIKKELSDAGDVTESKIIYLHWGDKCYEVDEQVTVIAYKQLSDGNMGTEPECIIKFLKNKDICNDSNNIKLLYIITDGLIESSSTQQCFRLNENIHYETVVFHAINKCLAQIDLSVAASFFKSRCIIYRNYELYDNINISEEFDYPSEINVGEAAGKSYSKINVENFASEKDNLKSYVKLKYINKFKHDALALQEINKLKKLRDRLFVELSSKSPNVVNLDTKDRNVFQREFTNTDWYKNLTSSVQSEKVDIEKAISTLINYIVSDTKSYSFDALKFDMKFDKPIEEEPIIDVNFSAEQEIEFPDIILDDEKGIPVIILTELNLLDKIIFHKTKESNDVSPASFNKFKNSMECPLFLLNDPDISESIGYFYTLNVYKELLKKDTKTEPRNRRPFHGGLVIIDTDEFDRYNDYIISATYFNFKKIKYNIGLFYYILWKNCDKKEWMDRNVVEHFKKYVMRRISDTVCKIGLSALPLDPQENTSLLTALWYCVDLSSSLFKDDPVNFMHERLRMFYGVTDSMIEILRHFDYDLDVDKIQKRRDLIRHVAILKRIPNGQEKVYYLLERIFKNVNGFLISEIDKPYNLNTLNYLKLNHKGMLPDDVIKEKVHLNNYVHVLHCCDSHRKTEDGKFTFEICDKTYRPFFTIDENTSYYSKLIEVTKKVVINNDDDPNTINISYDTVDSLEFDKILGLYKLFIHCVIDTKKYPTIDEYAEYVLKKKKYHVDKVTIFPNIIYSDIEIVYSRYQKIVVKVDVSAFIKVGKTYVRRSDRVKAEEVIQFKNFYQINKFIAKAEKKVNLKKGTKLN